MNGIGMQITNTLMEQKIFERIKKTEANLPSNEPIDPLRMRFGGVFLRFHL